MKPENMLYDEPNQKHFSLIFHEGDFRKNEGKVNKYKIDNRFLEIIESGTQTLVIFFSKSCGPCKTMKPILEVLNNTVMN